MVAAIGRSAAPPQTPNPEPWNLESLINTEITTVTGASKYQQEITDAPASVRVITQDDIRQGGYRTLADLLNTVPEFYTTYDRTYQYLGVQGFSPAGDYNTRVLVLVDGHRLNDDVFQQAPISDFPLDLALIDRVEVIRGPGSSVYGTNAFMAVINVITRSVKGGTGAELAASAGSYGDWTSRATAGGRTGAGLGWLVSGSTRDLPGPHSLAFPEYADQNGGVARGMDRETSSDFAAKLAWEHFSLLALHSVRDKEPPTAPFNAIFGDPAIRNQDRHSLVGLLYSRPDEFADLTVRITYNRYEYRGDWPLLDAGTRTLNRDTALGQSVSSDVFVSKTLGSQLLTLGMEDRWAFSQDQKNFNVSPVPGVIFEDARRSMVQGCYVQDEAHVRSNLILNVGARLDHYQSFGSTVNPRAALIWKPVDETILRLTYGQAFRAPSVYELYYADQVTLKANPGLQPERIASTEANWDQFLGDHLKTTLTAFRTRIRSLLAQVTDPVDGLSVFENQGRIEAYGLDGRAEGKWENGASCRIGFTFQNAHDDLTGHALVNSPRTLLKGAVSLPLPWPKAMATLEANYAGPRLNLFQERLGGATLANFTLLQRDLLPGLDLAVSAYNLLDTRASVPPGPGLSNSSDEALHAIVQDGFTVRVQATWRY